MYGTLRPGQVNYDLVAPDVIEQVPARRVGHCLKAAAHAGFPYAAAALGAEIVGGLLRMRPGAERQVLRRLDALEGYRPGRPETSHYLRLSLVVTTRTESSYGPTGCPVQAWVYLAGPRVDLTGLPSVPGGDWTSCRTAAGRWS